MTYTVLLGGRRKLSVEEAISVGTHPGAEYLTLRDSWGASLLTFDDVWGASSVAVRAVARYASPYWGMAVLARLQQGQREAILTTGEDIGLPLAIVQWLTAHRVPVGIITHGSYFASRKAALIFRLLRKMPNIRFLCLSETLCNKLIKQYQIPAERVYNVGYGVDTDFFQPAGTPQPCQIASAGMANRDYATLIAATAGKNLSVKIAIDSAWFKVKTPLTGCSLPPNIEARSYGDYVALRRLYAESTFVVVPLYEAVHACGYAVIAEAMAMGKPVISTRITGHSDYIVDGETGFYVPPGDAVALSERIEYLLKRPDLTVLMGQQARKLVEERYSLNAYTARLADALNPRGSFFREHERRANAC